MSMARRGAGRTCLNCFKPQTPLWAMHRAGLSLQLGSHPFRYRHHHVVERGCVHAFFCRSPMVNCPTQAATRWGAFLPLMSHVLATVAHARSPRHRFTWLMPWRFRALGLLVVDDQTIPPAVWDQLAVGGRVPVQRCYLDCGYTEAPKLLTGVPWGDLSGGDGNGRNCTPY